MASVFSLAAATLAVIHDPARLATLQSFEVLDTPPDPAFGRLTQLAAIGLHSPAAAIRFVAADRVWTKAAHGSWQSLPGNGAPEELAFALADHDLTVIADTLLDERTASVAIFGEGGPFRAVACAPLRTGADAALGYLVVADVSPREFSTTELDLLRGLADLTMDLLNARRAAVTKSIDGTTDESVSRIRDRYLRARVDLQRELSVGASVRERMPRVLELIGEVSQASRITLVRMRPEGSAGSPWGELEAQWCAPGVQPSRTEAEPPPTALDERCREVWLPRLRRGEIVAVHISELNRAERALFEQIGIQQMHVAAVHVHDQLSYALSFHDSLRGAAWSEAEFLHLQSMASGIGLALTNDVAKLALQAEKERLDVTLRSIGDGVVVADLEGCISMMNPVAEKLFGAPAADLIGQRLTDFFILDPPVPGDPSESSWPLNFDAVQHTIETGEIVQAARRVKLLAVDGRRVSIAGINSPLRDTRGLIVGVVRVIRDITLDERLAAELLKASKLESVGLLAGGIAHDFNNILTAIIGNLSLVTDVIGISGRAESPVRESLKAAWRACGLTTQLLTFSRGGVPLKKLTHLPALLRESITFALRGSRVSANFDLPDDLPPAEVDEGQLSQVFHNLAINAAQAMPSGGHLDVTASVEEMDGGPGLSILLRDDGPGIEAENLAKIFDPFFTTKPRGSGLGLTASYSIIRNHGGRIECQSSVGAGVTFRIRLPLPLRPTPTQITGAAPEDKAIIRGGGRVLVMDDEEPIRLLASRIVVSLGYEVETVADGTEALAAFEKASADGRPFATAILDLTIPGGMGGEEALRRIVALDPGFRAIVSSGYAADGVLAHHAKLGFVACLTKPYRVKMVADVLHTVLKSAGKT